jgi:secreted trypsin-like serine protease
MACGVAMMSGGLASAPSAAADAPAYHLQRPRPMIVGGSSASIADFPWQVALIDARQAEPTRSQYCGGTLIEPQWVLTAAHCFYDDGAVDADPAHVDVISGTARFAGGGTRSDAAQIIIHEGYNTTTQDNDIALIKLAAPVGQKTAPLAYSDGEITSNLIVTGWGDTSAGGSGSPDLLQATVPLVGLNTCHQAYNALGSPWSEMVTSNMICAGYAGGGTDACQGDSGGPLVTSDRSKLVGIVSHGKGCAVANQYGVYTKVSVYTAWISKAIWENTTYDGPGRSPPIDGCWADESGYEIEEC